MPKKLLIRGGISLLGMAAVLVWWTIRPGSSNTRSSDHIPAKVGNGGTTLQVAVETSSPATMRIDFSDLSKPAGSQQFIQTWEKIPASSRTWNVDVQPGFGGYIELDADGPKPGDSLRMDVKVNGQSVGHETDRLNQPLPPGTAFFVQEHFDDYSKASQEMNGSASDSAE